MRITQVETIVVAEFSRINEDHRGGFPSASVVYIGDIRKRAMRPR